MSAGILNTIGVEFETDQVNNRALLVKFNDVDRTGVGSYITTHNDASAQTPIFYVGGNNYLYCFKDRGFRVNLRTNRGVLGVELVTNPVSFDEITGIITNVVRALKFTGEYNTSARSSVHVHIGFYPRIQWMKSLLMLSLYAEPLLFKLSGFGYRFRGELNNSIYCRPLIDSPVVQFSNGEHRKMFDMLDIIKNIESINEDTFWHIFLSSGESRTLGQYPVGRYLSVNFLSLLIRGTIEFRTANISLNPNYLLAYIKLCQVLAELAIHLPFRDVKALTERAVFVTDKLPDKEFVEILNAINALSYSKNTESILSDAELNTLNEIIEITKTPVLLKNVLSHRCEQGFLAPSDYLTCNVLRPRVTDFIKSGFLDIHNNALFQVETNKVVGSMS